MEKNLARNIEINEQGNGKADGMAKLLTNLSIGEGKKSTEQHMSAVPTIKVIGPDGKEEQG
jgi:hypothetical protein